MRRAVIYCRVSTEEQAKSGLGLQNQLTRCKAYCLASNWFQVDTIVDDGISAKDLFRPGIEKVFELLGNKKADVLVILNLDRLTRSVKDLGAILDKMQSEGWEFASVENKVDTSTASGRLVLNVLMSVSQWERERIGERTRDALQQKKHKKEKTGGFRQFGYDIAIDENGKKKIVENSHEQKVIKLILSFRETDMTYKAICKELKRRKIKNAFGATNWNTGSISRIIQRNGANKNRKPRNDKGKKRNSTKA